MSFTDTLNRNISRAVASKRVSSGDLDTMSEDSENEGFGKKMGKWIGTARRLKQGKQGLREELRKKLLDAIFGGGG